MVRAEALWQGPKGAHDSGINRPYMPNFTSFGYICMNFEFYLIL